MARLRKCKYGVKDMEKNYDVVIVGAGPGGIFSAFELTQKKPELRVAVYKPGPRMETGGGPNAGKKIKTCNNCGA